MSIIPEAIWAPAPTTTRGQPTIIDADAKGERIVYASGKSIFVRSISDPSICQQYSGHTTTTTVARFSPSGFYVASGDISGTIRIWDPSGSSRDASSSTITSTKAEYAILSGRINDLAWDADSARLIAVGEGKGRFGHAFTADSGNSVGEISGHTARINCVAIRGQRPIRAVTGSDDCSLVFYHGTPFKYQAGIQGRHERYVYGAAFSPDGELFVSVGADARIWLYDGRTGEVKGEIGGGGDGHAGSIFGVSWAKDCKRIVTTGADRTVRVWDVEAGRMLQKWTLVSRGARPGEAQDQQVGVVWVRGRSEDLIIACNLAGDLTYLRPGSEEPLKVVQGHQKAISAFNHFSNPSPTLLTGSFEGKVMTRSLDGMAVTVSGETHASQVVGFGADLSGTKVCSLGWDDTLRSFDIKGNAFASTPTKLSNQPIASCTTAESVIVITSKPALDVYDVHHSKLLKSHDLSYSPTAVAAIKTSGVGDLQVAVGSSDKETRIYLGLQNASKPDHTLKHSTAPVTSLAFSSSSPHLLAVGDSAGKINVYDPAEKYALVTNRWSGHTARVTGIAWNAAGTHAVSCGLDTNIFLWNLKSPGKRVKATNAHKEGVSGVAWIDANRIVSTGADGAVKTWQIGGLE